MPIKKSELYTHLWKSCDELRGGMDASQYKDYVLVLLFVKYVSDKYAGLEDADVRIPEEGSFDDITISANTNINQESFKKIEICFPKNHEEQKAIAEVLSDMDAEIEALEKKRDKYQTMKQGIMQELLTGQTRLIDQN